MASRRKRSAAWIAFLAAEGAGAAALSVLLSTDGETPRLVFLYAPVPSERQEEILRSLGYVDP